MATAIPDVPLPIPPAREIPTTFSASFKSWWAAGEKESAAAEERLLRRLHFFQPSNAPKASTSHPVTAHMSKVELGSPKKYINTLAFEPTVPSSNAPPPAVVLHGYGAGLAFFFKNFETVAAWSARSGARAYALDWLGMGRSARPAFRVRAKRDDTDARVREAETFFLDSLEAWRAKMGLERMTLVGHSLGAYLATAYALRFPERVHKLVLLSPAGVPQNPNDDEPVPRTGRRAKSGSSSPAEEGDDPADASERARGTRRPRSTFIKVAHYLWEEGYSPFGVVRSSLFWGPLLVGKYSARRFPTLSADDTRDLHAYIFGITAARGSGEYCISHILAPGAYARRPLVDRVAALPRNLPVTFVYGDQDWMDPAGGSESVARLRAAGNLQSRMYIVPNAGHHLYLDNPEVTNQLLAKALDAPVL